MCAFACLSAPIRPHSSLPRPMCLVPRSCRELARSNPRHGHPTYSPAFGRFCGLQHNEHTRAHTRLDARIRLFAKSDTRMSCGSNIGGTPCARDSKHLTVGGSLVLVGFHANVHFYLQTYRLHQVQTGQELGQPLLWLG